MTELEELQRRVAAQAKTIAVLRTAAERAQAEGPSARSDLRESALLERVVKAKTDELATTLAQLKETQAELLQAQKLESVGRLAAGVAHEINTPIQFTSDSVAFVEGAVVDLCRLLEAYRGLAQRVRDGNAQASEAQAIAALEETLDVSYASEELPKAVSRCKDGLTRVASIVSSMKEFAHPGGSEPEPVDLNRAVKVTLTMARNEYRYVADVALALGELPAVWCVAGEINQVILNLVVNAAHAIGDAVAHTGGRGTITVRTRLVGEHVELDVEDTGTGIKDSVRAKIFEPFFTTKEVGRGTGQGLAISRSVVDKHQGELSFRTEVGKGTCFTVRLPLRR